MCPLFKGWDKNLLLGEALNLAVICQKLAFKLLTYENNGENLRKMQILTKNFNFLAEK